MVLSSHRSFKSCPSCSQRDVRMGKRSERLNVASFEKEEVTVSQGMQAAPGS